jgi:tetratricopeptide (TPR) repeat protein
LTQASLVSEIEQGYENSLENILMCDDPFERSELILDFLTNSPKNPKAYIELAICHVELKNFKVVKLLLNKSFSLGCNEWEFKIWLGYYYISLGNYVKAEIQLHKAISIMPTNDTAYSLLAELYEEQGKLQESEELYRKALSFEPDFSENHARLAQFLIKNERREEAVTSLKWALYIEPECETAIELIKQHELEGINLNLNTM